MRELGVADSLRVVPAGAVAGAPTRFAMGLALMAASGAAALGYEIVWTQQAALWIGQESAAVLAILAAFFGGLGLGSAALGGAIDRSAHPARWYAGCEIAIGLWCVVLAFALPQAAELLLRANGIQPSPLRQWGIAFGGTFLLLLPATVAMGATMPAVARMLDGCRARHAPIGALYAANTFGAVLGVLGAAFVLVPSIGLQDTAWICAGLNFACAALALKGFGGGTAPAAIGTGATSSVAVAAAARRANRGAATALLAVTGLLGIGFEVLAVRVLSQVAENTVYTFALLLAAYLLGTALGAAAYQRWLEMRLTATDPALRRAMLLVAVAAACLFGLAGMAFAPAIKAVTLGLVDSPGLLAALLAEAALALAALLLPALAMGALFSELCTQARAHEWGLGHAIGANTLGAVLAPALFGVVLVPAIGMQAGVLTIVAAYLALAALQGVTRSAPRTHGAKPRAAAAGLAVVVLATLAFAGESMGPGSRLTFVDVPVEGRLLSLEQGPTATVSVVEDGAGVRRLHIDNRQQEGSSATLLADARQALLPMLLHPAPRSALFLGVGTGVTASAAARERGLAVDAVELLPEVIAATRYFQAPQVSATERGRPSLLAADARRFVRTATRRYDLIVSDNFHPARSGSGSLYTIEHFAAVRERLAPGGVFCQWLPLHQLDLDSLRSIVRAFLAVNPQAWATLATNSLETPVFGLVARRDAALFDLDAVRTRLARIDFAESPARFGFGDEWAVLGGFVAGPRALTAFAGDATPNSDDRPIVAYRAPRITYAPDSRPRDRLLTLMEELTLEPGDLLERVDIAAGTRLAAYWQARNRFLEAGRNVQLRADAGEMLEQVREPLLAVLRISPDFRPAYDPLLAMARELGDADDGGVRALLAELQRLQPSRPEAADVLASFAAAGPAVVR